MSTTNLNRILNKWAPHIWIVYYPTLDGLRAQSAVGCFPVLWFLQFSVAQVLVGLRKEFIDNLVFPTWAYAVGFNNKNKRDQICFWAPHTWTVYLISETKFWKDFINNYPSLNMYRPRLFSWSPTSRMKLWKFFKNLPLNPHSR